MPPEIITIVSPSTTSPNSANCRPRSLSALAEKKSGINRPNTTTATTSARNGIALSIQRLLKSSPIR